MQILVNIRIGLYGNISRRELSYIVLGFKEMTIKNDKVIGVQKLTVE